MLYHTTFTVVGKSTFPLDMLRRDACYPESEEAVTELDISLDEYTRGDTSIVKLAKTHTGKDPHITTARWASFGWGVDVSSIRTRKV